MKTLPIGPFLGLNNRLPDTALNTEHGSWLKEAVNVDIDNAGRVRSRDDVTLIQAMTGAHSVFATSANTGYFSSHYEFQEVLRDSDNRACTCTPPFLLTFADVCKRLQSQAPRGGFHKNHTARAGSSRSHIRRI